MPLKSSAISVGAVTPVKLASGLTATATVPVSVIAVSTAAWLAGGTNDTAPVYPVAANAPLSIDLAPGDDLYGLSATGTITVNVLVSRQ